MKDIVERLNQKAEARKAICPPGISVNTDATGVLMQEAGNEIEELRILIEAMKENR